MVTTKRGTKRKQAVEAVLAYAPYVLLTGPSGTGKTSFVQHAMRDTYTALFEGEDAVLAWATSTPQDGQRSVLFLDLDKLDFSKDNWASFCGLSHLPPGIVWQGKYYPILPGHKVIFKSATNPCENDEHQLTSLFTNDACRVIFSPMTLAFIYEKLLKPKLDTLFLLDRRTKQNTASAMFDIYQFVRKCQRDNTPISTRELETMLILAIVYQQRNPSVSWKDIIAHYRYSIAMHYVLPQHRTKFDEQFKPRKTIPLPSMRSTSSSSSSSYFTPSQPIAQHDFCVTASRQPIITALHDFLAWRNIRRSGPIELASTLTGGVSGLLLEGPSGIGKTELVLWFLNTQGYQALSGDKTYTKAEIDRGYYLIPMSLGEEERRILWHKAAAEGAFVVTDEINTGPLMQDLLITLFAKNAESTPIDQSGLFLIAMQNPPTFPGRVTASQTLSHRWLTMDVPRYEESEIKTIIDALDIEEPYAEALAEAVKTVSAEATVSQHMRYPNIRDLLQLIEKIRLKQKEARLLHSKSAMYHAAESSASSTSSAFHSAVERVGSLCQLQ